METNQIIHADCMTILPEIESKTIQLLLTDIPYGEVNRPSNGLRNFDKGAADTTTFELDAFLTECIRVTKGSIYIFCGTEQVSEIRKKFVDNKMSTRLCILHKTNPSPANGQHLWLNSVECCVYGKFPKATFNERCKSSVWNYPCSRNKLHPTQKPLKLMEYLIKTSSNEGDIVLDPCAGAGTTLVAAKKLNRRYIGIEKDENYYKIACEEVEKKRPVLEVETFDIPERIQKEIEDALKGIDHPFGRFL